MDVLLTAAAMLGATGYLLAEDHTGWLTFARRLAARFDLYLTPRFGPSRTRKLPVVAAPLPPRVAGAAAGPVPAPPLHPRAGGWAGTTPLTYGDLAVRYWADRAWQWLAVREQWENFGYQLARWGRAGMLPDWRPGDPEYLARPWADATDTFAAIALEAA